MILWRSFVSDLLNEQILQLIYFSTTLMMIFFFTSGFCYFYHFL